MKPVQSQGRAYIFICVHLQKVIFHIAQMLPDKCPGNAQYFHGGWRICHRWDGGQSRAQMGTSPLMVALKYELQVEADEHVWLISSWVLTSGKQSSESGLGPNELHQTMQEKSCKTCSLLGIFSSDGLWFKMFSNFISDQFFHVNFWLVKDV